MTNWGFVIILSSAKFWKELFSFFMKKFGKGNQKDFIERNILQKKIRLEKN